MARAGIRIVVVDDHPVIREGIGNFFEFVDDVDVVGTAPDTAQARTLIAEVTPDVVLLDLGLPGMDGADYTRELSQVHPGVRVILFTATFQPERLRMAVANGAMGVVSKTAPPPRLLEIIRIVARGGRAIDPDMEGELAAPGPTRPLSERETEVLRCMADGQTNKEIADTLFIAEATAKKHVENIRQKLGANDRAAAVAEGFRRGLIR